MTREVLFNVEGRHGQRAQRTVDCHAPAPADRRQHAQMKSTTIPLHQIGTIRTTFAILASDRNCFFPGAQLHEMKRFRGRYQIGGLQYFKCGWNAHFRLSQWYSHCAFICVPLIRYLLYK